MSTLYEAWMKREREIDLEQLAQKVASELVSALEASATLAATDVASRRREEVCEWALHHFEWVSEELSAAGGRHAD